MKIVYILPTLDAKGGTERIVTEKANYLVSHFGYEVYIICMYQQVNEPSCYPLSDKIHQINLGIPYYSQYKYKYPKRLFYKIRIHKQLKEELNNTIQLLDPDILISISYAMADIVSKIPSKAFKITECHEPRELVMSKIYNNSLFARIYAKYYYFRTIEKNSDIVITLTNESKKSWQKAKRVEVIPNFSSMEITQQSNCMKRIIISVGRLGKEKGYDRLIDIWKSISAKYSDWQLDIYGDGQLRDELNNIIKSKHIQSITLQGQTNDISQEYANSSICVVTSYFEGFSLVILEAMKHGVPCVAFDCPYGPRSIIEDGKNGYLVEDGNISLFVEKLCSLIENTKLRLQFSEAAKERAKYFDTDKIMLQWKSLFEDLYNGRI